MPSTLLECKTNKYKTNVCQKLITNILITNSIQSYNSSSSIVVAQEPHSNYFVYYEAHLENSYFSKIDNEINDGESNASANDKNDLICTARFSDTGLFSKYIIVKHEYVISKIWYTNLF